MANSNFVVKNGLTVGALTIDASNGNITTTGTITGDVNTSTIAQNDTSLAINDSGSSSTFVVTVDGTSLFSITGDGIIPSVNSNGTTGFDLGSSSFAWRDLYVSEGSLYVNGQKVLSDNSGTITVSADTNQNISVQTAGSGDIELDATGSGLVAIKSTLQIEDGVNITNSGGNAISFANSIDVDAIESRSTDTNLTLSANGSGIVTVNDSLTVTGDLTVSGTTTTVNSETINLADNIIQINSNFTSGTPTEDAGLTVLRGGSASKTLLWAESTDRWTVGSESFVAGTFIGDLTGDVTGNADTATTLATTRAIQLTGAVTGTANFDGSAAITISTTATADPTITLGGDLSGAVTLTNLASGTLTATVGTLNQSTTGSAATLTTARAIEVSGAVTGTANFDGSGAINISTTATADPTITLGGDLSGAVTLTNLASGTLTATITKDPIVSLTGAVTGSGTMTNLGNVSIATTATADPTITLGGDLSGSATLTNLGNATLTATIVANSVALGTDTTGNYVGAGAVSGVGLSGSVSSEGGTFTVTSNATSANTASAIVARDGSGNFSAGVITGTATAARYADLAERYEAESTVEPGTVVHFGGSKEIKECDEDMCSRVAGIISTAPAYMMNSDAGNDETHPYVALKGRVPCKVQGTVQKGDMMVSAGNGKARAEANPTMGSVIGKALADSEGEAVIEVIVL
jgi:hypothetical protein